MNKLHLPFFLTTFVPLSNMEEKTENIGHLDFEEYIREGEPEMRERAYAWRTAIGLQAVDGLQVSDYLRTTARRNIEGEITIDEARDLIKTYYQTKTKREPDDDEKQEADRVSGNITRILSRQTLDFTAHGFIALHRRIFEGVLKHAGEVRKYDITKKEWVLRGDTVNYLNFEDVRRAIDYDISQERAFNYHGMSIDETVAHITKFVAGLWQIHPFGEGNTRTTAVFTIQYLRSIGFDVNNDLFAKHSWYFRNALVRANYKNVVLGVDYTPVFLERFFRNLLLGENNELRNRYLVINLPESLQTPPPSSTPSSTPASSLATKNENVLRLVKALGMTSLSIKEMLQAVGLKDRKNFLEYSLRPAIKEGFVTLLYPDKPHHPRQKYLLTVKGQAMYHELTKA